VLRNRTTGHVGLVMRLLLSYLGAWPRPSRFRTGKDVVVPGKE